MIINSPLQIRSDSLFYHLPDYCATENFYLKLEGLNIASSIKLKSAEKMISELEKSYGELLKEKVLVCSSSGNLGIALSIICKVKQYSLLCVSDPNISLFSKELIQTYGAKLHIIESKDKNGGFLGSRIEYIKNLIRDSKYLWLNQYANENNKLAHYETTAQEICSEIADITHLFVGAGTTGTLMGCASYFRENLPNVKIIAVDAKGSVTFGGAPLRRYIPGLGTSRKPELADESIIDDVIHVAEKETIFACRYFLENKGLFIGGSTGTVLAAVKKYNAGSKSVIVAISPDFGDKYINSVYSQSWVNRYIDIEEIKDGV